MPFGLGPFGAFSSSDIGAGRQFTRLRAPIFVGMQAVGDLPGIATAGASVNPPSIINFSTLRGDLLLSVVSTVISTAGSNVTTSAPSGLVYISQTTGAGNIVAGGSTANAPVG